MLYCFYAKYSKETQKNRSDDMCHEGSGRFCLYMFYFSDIDLLVCLFPVWAGFHE